MTDKIGLVGAAVSDYPQIDELVDFLLENKVKISVSSLRVESVKPGLIRALAISGQQTITFAPEAGSNSLRSSLNKKIKNQQILDKINLAKTLGIKKIKLYFMVGLPEEKESDIQAIIGLVKSASKILLVKASIGIFVPKPLTPFADCPMATKKDILKKLKILKSSFSKLKNVSFNSSRPKEAMLAYQISRADQDFIDKSFKNNKL
jgi:radical SAM superfamily enzyme YgiQ (UPF0313 family)